VTIDCAPDKQEIAPCIRDLYDNGSAVDRVFSDSFVLQPRTGSKRCSGETVPPKLAVNIEAQPIRDALKAFGEQTGLQILIRSEDLSLNGVTTPRVAGELSCKKPWIDCSSIPDSSMNSSINAPSESRRRDRSPR